MIKELTKWIEAETTFVVGTNLFAGFIAPTKQDEAIILIETGGIGSFYLNDKREKMLQVLSRSKDYHKASENAETIYTLLVGNAGITLPQVDGGQIWYVNTIDVQSLPQSLGQDERGNYILSANYIVRAQHN